MLAIIEHLQSINRSMLNRLRPMALGHVPLHDILAELVRERARQHPEIEFAFSAHKLMRGYGDSVDLTVYRCVQESLTNVIRHAQAKHVGVELGEAASEGNGNGERGASRSPCVTTAAASIPRRRRVSACAACRNACKGSAAATRWKRRAAAAPA